LADSKGLRYIHRLLETPGVEVYALDLEVGSRAAAAIIVPDEEGVYTGPPSREDIVDQQALRAYRQRIEELREELEEADRNNDAERASGAREELEYLIDEVARVTQPRGTPTKMRDETERARVNVTRTIKSAIQKISEQDQSLGHHLDHDIRTGTYCLYKPDPATAPDWAL
jgi:FMN phosphatase YigB (HAD superfamily)